MINYILMKSKILILCVLSILCHSSTYAQSGNVGIGITIPDGSAILDISSTDSGVLIPRMNFTQRNAISSPAIGLLIYQTNDTIGFHFYNGSKWVLLTDGTKTIQINNLSDGKSDNDGTNNGSSIFLGIDAGKNDNSTDNKNVGLGFKALKSNTTGYNNTANGYRALFSNTTGNRNTANGYRALYLETTGSSNVAMGSHTLYSNTNRSNLVAIGDSALYNNGLNVTQSFHATKNTAIGSKTLYSNTRGFANTGLGYVVLYNNTTGHHNTALGSFAQFNNSSGFRNVAIGTL